MVTRPMCLPMGAFLPWNIANNGVVVSDVGMIAYRMD